MFARLFSGSIMTSTPSSNAVPVMPTPPLVLIFSATDPSSGAGMQADILASSSLGAYPLCVVTAVTVQDTVGVESVHPIDAEIVEQQARAILEDMPVGAFKIGLLGSVENVIAVAEVIADYPEIPVVFDPVLASGRGDDLSGEDMIAAMQELLFPQTTVLTPNSLEARRLAYHHPRHASALDNEGEDNDEGVLPGELPVLSDEEHQAVEMLETALQQHEAEEGSGTEISLGECARQLHKLGCQFVLITGTHENTSQVTNSLYGENGLRLRSDNWERLPGSYHGSGCTLASAIAACLAAGTDIETAVKEGQDYTWQTLANAFRPGMGQFIPDRLFWARGEEEENLADAPPHNEDDLIQQDEFTVSDDPSAGKSA